MRTDSSPELARAMGPVARDLLGDPNEDLSSKDELRYGTRGSLCIDLRKGTWFDSEGARGGGVLALVQDHKQLDKDGALEWLHERGHIAPPERKKGGGFNIVATYDYTDEAGELLFQVTRLDPKDFRQRRPDGIGGWTWKTKGMVKVVYHLPEVVAAIAVGRPIHVAEGEKAVDSLRALGVAATCSPGGAGKWRKEYSPSLAGADVVLLPDNDQPGWDHAKAVAKALGGFVGSVRTLALPNLPTKGDAADWIAAGGTAAELERLAAEAEKAPEAPRKANAERAARDADGAALDGFLLNEDGVALAFTKQHQGHLLYCHTAKHWYFWTDEYWKREETKLAFAWARKVCRDVARDLPPDDKAKHILARASTAGAVERFAQADRAFAVTHEAWDRNPWLLGTPKGTVDLRTGELREAEPGDRITKRTLVAPAAKGAAHPVWTAFLEQATAGDAALQTFLQRFVGYL